MRLGERLHVRWDITSAARAAWIPQLILQPLIENAIRRVGCNNVLDRPPPIVGPTNLPLPVGNGNTFPGVYVALVREIDRNGA